MADTAISRTARLEITIDGVNVSKDIAPFLISFTYDDNKSGEADSISVTLEDTDGRFRGDWFPKRNATVTAKIVATNWKEQEDKAVLNCGTFELDEIEVTQGSITLKGVSVPVTSGGRNEKATKTWEKAYLKTIAKDVAEKAGLALNYTAKENPYFGRVDQKQESALEFLGRIVNKTGLAIKVVNSKITIYDELEAEQETATKTITRTGGYLLAWRFKTQSVDTYKSCTVTYFDTKTKQTYTGTATSDGDDDPSGQVLKITNERVESNAQAITLAEKQLRECNKREVTGSMETFGDVELLDGVIVQVSDFGTFDGKYRVSKSSHKIDSGGYTTNIELESGPASVRSGGKGEKKAAKKKSKGSGTDYAEYFD